MVAKIPTSGAILPHCPACLPQPAFHLTPGKCHAEHPCQLCRFLSFCPGPQRLQKGQQETTALTLRKAAVGQWGAPCMPPPASVEKSPVPHSGGSTPLHWFSFFLPVPRSCPQGHL